MGHEFLETQSAIDANAGHDWCPFIPVFGAPAEMFERGEGTQLWSVSGKRYLDFLSGIAVVGLGHANPVIADAIADQARTRARLKLLCQHHRHESSCRYRRPHA